MGMLHSIDDDEEGCFPSFSFLFFQYLLSELHKLTNIYLAACASVREILRLSNLFRKGICFRTVLGANKAKLKVQVEFLYVESHSSCCQGHLK